MGRVNLIEAIGGSSKRKQGYLKHYFSILKKRGWIVLLVLLCTVASTAVVTILTPPVFRASAQIFVEKTTSSHVLNKSEGVIARRGNIYLKAKKHLSDRKLALSVIETLSLWTVLGYGEMTAVNKSDIITDYLKALKIDPAEGKNLLNVSFQCRSPQLAAEVVNTHLRYFRNKHDRTKIKKTTTALEPEPGTAPKPDRAIEPLSVRIVKFPKEPKRPVRPDKLLNMLLALIAGLFFGTGVAVFCEHRDTRAQSTGTVEWFDMPVLASIPKNRQFKRLADFFQKSDPSQNPIEYRNVPAPLKLSVLLLNALKKREEESNGRLIVLESVAAGDGKSTILSNMAISLLNTGLRTLVVDCNFKRPVLHSIFGKANDYGLQEVMKKVLSEPLQRGMLQEHSVEDLFFLAGLKRFSGQLLITNSPYVDFHDMMKALGRMDDTFSSSSEGQVMRISFSQGRPVMIENQFGPQEKRLGTVLHNKGLITREQMQDALDRNKNTGLPLGYILINMDYITRDDLQGPLRIQMEENLSKAFSWKEGTYSFEADDPRAKGKKGIYYEEDFTDFIDQMGPLSGSVFVHELLMKSLTPIATANLYLLTGADGSISHGAQNMGNLTNIRMISKFLNILKRSFDVILVDTAPISDVNGLIPLASAADGALFLLKADNSSMEKVMAAKQYVEDCGCNVIGAILNKV